MYNLPAWNMTVWWVICNTPCIHFCWPRWFHIRCDVLVGLDEHTPWFTLPESIINLLLTSLLYIHINLHGIIHHQYQQLNELGNYCYLDMKLIWRSDFIYSLTSSNHYHAIECFVIIYDRICWPSILIGFRMTAAVIVCLENWSEW